MAPVLQIRDLSVEYRLREGTLEAVRGFSFAIEAGEVAALVGESGAGKTSVGLSILGIVPDPGVISSGQILLDGRPISGLSDAELRAIRGDAISMIFQDPVAGLNPIIQVGAQVEEVIASHRSVRPKEAREMALETLATMRLPDPKRIAKSFPGELSGGMCQRVMIAIATVLEPKVLIADEPTSALDVTVQAQILSELDELRRTQGTAILLITHDLGVVAQLADSVSVLYAGALVEHGDVQTMFKAPRHPYTASLLATLPRLDGRRRGRLRQIGGNPPDMMSLDGHCPFLERCPKAQNECRERDEPRLEQMVGSPAGHEAACYNPMFAG